MTMLSTVLRNLVTGPVTTAYPNAPAEVPGENRGWVEWDMSKCSLCGLCGKRCPTLALAVDRKAGTIELQVFRCIACGVCVDVCPQDSIAMHPEYSKPGYVKEVRKYHKDSPTDGKEDGTPP
jgi:formate hydrogenlyase subunit 6/NADH:ubiquinone oxidoreductase subunit I